MCVVTMVCVPLLESILSTSWNAYFPVVERSLSSGGMYSVLRHNALLSWANVAMLSEVDGFGDGGLHSCFFVLESTFLTDRFGEIYICVARIGLKCVFLPVFMTLVWGDVPLVMSLL